MGESFSRNRWSKILSRPGSWNHEMGGIGKDLEVHLVPWTEHLLLDQVTHSLVQPDLEHVWQSTTFLGSEFWCLTILLIK